MRAFLERFCTGTVIPFDFIHRSLSEKKSIDNFLILGMIAKVEPFSEVEIRIVYSFTILTAAATYAATHVTLSQFLADLGYFRPNQTVLIHDGPIRTASNHVGVLSNCQGKIFDSFR